VKILGISGSLRGASYNTSLVRSAGDLLPPGPTLDVLDFADVPVYNDDLGTPESVARARAAVGAADALLISTPEYNHSVAGPLKNLIDWLSRPPGGAVISGRPTAILSASPGAIGGARAQQHLKVILLASGVPVFHGAEVVVGNAASKFADGRLTDEATRKFLADWLAKFTAWASRAG
jgi:chromate reductase